MSVHFDAKNLEIMEKALNRLKQRNHGSYDIAEIERCLYKIREYKKLYDIK
jgi:hypothetical protein